MKFALGQAVPRTEDPRLLTGRGRYTDDLVLPLRPRLCSAHRLRMPVSTASSPLTIAKNTQIFAHEMLIFGLQSFLRPIAAGL